MPKGVLTRREREKQQRREDILRAAQQVIAAKGYHRASIEEIARVAEYGTGTVYLYFKDKESLYLELFTRKISELLEVIEEQIRGESEPLAALRQLIEARIRYFEQNRSFFQIFIREGMHWGGSRQAKWAPVQQMFAGYLGMLAGLIRKAQEKKQIRKEDPHRLAVALSGMMMQLTLEWLENQATGESLQEQANFVYHFFLQGAQAR